MKSKIEVVLLGADGLKWDGLKFPTKLWLPGQETWVIFYKIYHKISLALSNKEMDQYIIFFVAAVGLGRGFFKESPAFWVAHTCANLTWRKFNMEGYKKIWTKEISGQVYQI